MTATIERLPGSSRLPRPGPGRMRPLRAGILNVWEYDEQEFWLHVHLEDPTTERASQSPIIEA